MSVKTFTPVLILAALIGSCSLLNNLPGTGSGTSPSNGTVPSKPSQTTGNPPVTTSPGNPPPVTSSQPVGTALVSSDGRSQITLPSGWVEDRELHDSAQLQASKRLDELYVIVLSESKADFQNLSLPQHSEITRELLLESLTNPETTGPTQVTSVGGNPAVQYQIRGTIDSINVTYLHTTVETPNNYHQILTWTLPSNFDTAQPELQQLVQSFREVQ